MYIRDININISPIYIRAYVKLPISQCSSACLFEYHGMCTLHVFLYLLTGYILLPGVEPAGAILEAGVPMGTFSYIFISSCFDVDARAQGRKYGREAQSTFSAIHVKAWRRAPP